MVMLLMILQANKLVLILGRAVPLPIRNQRRKTEMLVRDKSTVLLRTSPFRKLSLRTIDTLYQKICSGFLAVHLRQSQHPRKLRACQRAEMSSVGFRKETR